MVDYSKIYIDGQWVEPQGSETLEVINPATEEACATISLGNAEDVDRAVAAARRAFESYSQTTREERVALLGKIVEVYKRRMEEVAAAITTEMGAPAGLAMKAQAPAGRAPFAIAQQVRENSTTPSKRTWAPPSSSRNRLASAP